MIYCLFEQSGHFRDEFIDLGYNACDIDIENQFNQTDIKYDIFKLFSSDEPSVLEWWEKRRGSRMIAFFPCIRFSIRCPLNARGENAGMVNWNIEKKLMYPKTLVQSVSEFYTLWCNMFERALKYDIKLVVENPYSKQGFLANYFPIKPKFIDMDRTKHGDYFKKPTQFFFVNCEPSDNESHAYQVKNTRKTVATESGIERSLIARDYCRWFIESKLSNFLEGEPNTKQGARYEEI